MIIIDLWLEFGSHFHQDFLLDYPDFFSGISALLADFTLQEKIELKEYLVSIIESELSPKEMAIIWEKSGAEFFVSDTQTKEFLSQILEVINDEITKSQPI